MVALQAKLKDYNFEPTLAALVTAAESGDPNAAAGLTEALAFKIKQNPIVKVFQAYMKGV